MLRFWSPPVCKSFLIANNKGADQTARMCSLICVFVVRMQQSQVFFCDAVAHLEGVLGFAWTAPLPSPVFKYPMKMKNFVSMTPNYYLIKIDKISKSTPPPPTHTHPYTYEPPFQKSWVRPCDEAHMFDFSCFFIHILAVQMSRIL